MLYKTFLILGLSLSLVACKNPSQGTQPSESTAASQPTSASQSDAGAQASQGYFEVAHDGRVYVLGSQASAASFGKTHHLPLTKTLIGEGPSGETLVFEESKDDSGLTQRLIAEYRKRNLFYAEVAREGRIYIVGDTKTRENVETSGHMPYAKTFIGDGPGGKTLVFQIDPKNVHLQARLISEFETRHGISLR